MQKTLPRFRLEGVVREFYGELFASSVERVPNSGADIRIGGDFRVEDRVVVCPPSAIGMKNKAKSFLLILFVSLSGWAAENETR